MECILTNDELIKKCNDWVHKLAKSGGNAWTLKVPVDFNNDPDMLFLELGKLYLVLERLDEAQEAFQRSMELVGNQPYALFKLGVIAYLKKNLYDARLHFSRLISIASPEDFALEEENLYQLAQHYLEILNRREFKRSSFKLM